MVIMLNTACYCCSGKAFANCCEPLLKALAIAATPEELMRSRYSAYATANIDYIVATMRGKAAKNFDPIDAKMWAQNCNWQKLEVLFAPVVADNATVGWVEFKAYYSHHNQNKILHEKSKFVKKNNKWFYLDGQLFS